MASATSNWSGDDLRKVTLELTAEEALSLKEGVLTDEVSERLEAVTTP